MADYRVAVSVLDRSGNRLDETILDADDYGEAMIKLADWAKASFYWKDL